MDLERMQELENPIAFRRDMLGFGSSGLGMRADRSDLSLEMGNRYRRGSLGFLDAAGRALFCAFPVADLGNQAHI